MLDINQTLSNIHHADSDPEGYMFDLEHWSPQIASRLALQEELELDDEHWEVIFYLRERYRNRGNQDSARLILHELEQHFASGSGNTHLYELFPGGPVSQGSRLAGLPLPPHSLDIAFGTAM